MINYYDKYFKEFVDSTIGIDMTAFYDKFLKYLNVGDYILDLGCGTGRDLRFFKEKEYKVLGVDSSKKLAEFAENFAKTKVINLDFRQLTFNSEFDAIWASASLLHLKKKEINLVLEKCNNALKPNGIMYVSFKFGTFKGYINQRYFTNFTEESFVTLLSGLNSFRINELWKSKDLRKERKNKFWLNAILQKK